MPPAGRPRPTPTTAQRSLRRYSSARPRWCHPSVPPRRTATSFKPAVSKSAAAWADRRSVLQTTTIGWLRLARSDVRSASSVSGTLTAPGRCPGGEVNSSGWRTSRLFCAEPAKQPGQECNHGKHSDAEESITQRRRIAGRSRSTRIAEPSVGDGGAERRTGQVPHGSPDRTNRAPPARASIAPENNSAVAVA